jgi:hypothetical protein
MRLKGLADFLDKDFAVSWPAAQVHRPHISVELLHFAARSQREQVKLSSREQLPRRDL